MEYNITENTSIIIHGGKKICGQVHVGGDKISAVHLLFASLMSSEKTKIVNMSFCGDIIQIIGWIEKSNIAKIKKSYNSIEIVPSNTDFDLTSISKSRASICLVSASALKFGKTEINSNIGGCCFANRMIDLHLDLIKTFGISIRNVENKFVAIKKRTVDKVEFNCSTKFGPSVGVTAHALIAAMIFRGEMVLTNIALEPALTVLIDFVRKSTNRKIVLKDRIVKISSMKRKNHYPATISLPYDVTVALTYISILMATGGNVYLKGVGNFPKAIDKLLRKMNAKLILDEDGVNVHFDNIIHPKFIKCTPWPGFPSDAGPIILAGLCSHKGETVLIDKVYDKRSTHVEGLNKMGFRLFSRGQNITVKGRRPINNNDVVIVNAMDIRAGAALVIGSLARNAETVIVDAYQIFRGYQNFVNDLRNFGIDIKTGEMK